MKNKNYNTVDLVKTITTEFLPMHGDRIIGEDKSIECGIGRINNESVSIIMQVSNSDIYKNIACNFSMTKPEGYRKSLRIMKQAEKFNRPIICFIDTIGAEPSIEAEMHGQISAIANNISTMLDLSVPIVCVITGNAYSGGAVGLCVCDKLAVLETANLGCISPRARKEILNEDIILNEVHEINNGFIDEIINENDIIETHYLKTISNRIKDFIISSLTELNQIEINRLINQRYRKFF